MPSRRLKKIACLNCSPPIPSLLHYSITRVVNHLKEIDRSLDSPRARVGGAAPSPLGANQITVNKLSLPVKLPFQGLSKGNWEQDIAKCQSSLSSLNGCINEIYGTLSRGKFGVIGPACCKSITIVSDKCWPKMFPLNPLFPLLLKSKCAYNASRAVPTPKGI
ncbi:hypothetical protein SO802_001223 [Lithocarpus litseifolius]|uniref:Prolamin-like domain-containing protein n=1 Tax=Lithocarpus litseifolius TaxID=425828 RepID=A0AAW2DXJ3_9ROSI